MLREVATLSLNSVVDISTPRTMKLRGQIENQVIVVLINCEASHNFTATDLVQKLGIPRVGTHSFGVLMSMGLSVKGEGICKGVVLKLQNIVVV